MLSLQETNIPNVGKDVARAGISCILTDPLLQPVGSGLVASLVQFGDYGCPKQ